MGNNLRDQLNQWKKKNNQQEAIPTKKKPEKLSQRDLMDLMGTNKRGYTRKRGVIRQK
ncbi:hypothetical protein [Sutcliffiella horikoshii]|uniref:hypothetical protein n=1 Tax=Sutcliffiella horikoshii TaxID=79883 RepID=UPI003D816E95